MDITSPESLQRSYTDKKCILCGGPLRSYWNVCSSGHEELRWYTGNDWRTDSDDVARRLAAKGYKVEHNRATNPELMDPRYFIRA